MSNLLRADDEFIKALKNYKDIIKQKHNIDLSDSQATKLLAKQLQPENIIKKKEKQKYYLDFEPNMRF